MIIRSDGTNEIIKKFEMMDKVKIFYHKKKLWKGRSTSYRNRKF